MAKTNSMTKKQRQTFKNAVKQLKQWVLDHSALEDNDQALYSYLEAAEKSIAKA
jgi:hypothetical protein